MFWLHWKNSVQDAWAALTKKLSIYDLCLLGENVTPGFHQNPFGILYSDYYAHDLLAYTG